MSFARDVLKPILDDMSSGLGSLFGLHLEDILKSPEEFSPASGDLMHIVSAGAIAPAAATILVVLFMLELSRLSVRTDGDGELFTKLAFFTLIKFVMLKIVFDNSPILMGGIYAVFAEMAQFANQSTMHFVTTDASTMEGFLDAVDRMDWLAQTVLIIIMLLAWLVNKGAVIAAFALIVVRFVKLFIYYAFAPVAVAFFASEHTRSFGIGFLRNFGAVVLQALVMVLAFAVYGAATSGWGARAFANVDDNAIVAALSIGSFYIFLGVVLAMIVLGSGRIANELLGN